MTLAIDHLKLRLRPIHRVIAAAARRQAEDIARLASSPNLIEARQVAHWVLELDSLLATGNVRGERASATREEIAEEQALRALAGERAEELPLDRIATAAELDAFELEALLVCAAVELDSKFGGLVAFIQDDVARRCPTIGLLSAMSATSLADLPQRRRSLGRLGRLRRCGLLRVATPGALERDDELVLGSKVLDALLGNAQLDARDPLEVVGTRERLPPHVDQSRLNQLADAVRERTVSIIGVWGGQPAERAAVVHALGKRGGLRPRALAATADPYTPCALKEAADDAAALARLLWIDLGTHQHIDTILDVLRESPACVCITGAAPLRSSGLIATKRYAELLLPIAAWLDRQQGWLEAIPELAPARAADLAARYRLGTAELAAIANTARTAAMLASNGHAANVADFVEPACAMLVQARSRQLAHVVTPRRGLAEIVLAPELERQVTELVQAFRAWPRIVETWGLARAAAGGLKALFAGEPGTGKTLAAEAIAHELGLALVKIDLAQVVSKWVGETEKNLDIVFREAEDGNAVLFFDEAEALFGKRGEVRHGTDRYANLEVSYLLQRLESHDGLVVLASNLKGEIDDAFTRRFHSVLYFSRPGEAERRRLWRLALPPSVPLADDVDLGLLAKLDLTGAGIVAAVRTAALRAAQADAPQITASDLVFGIARQFQRESRLLTPTDLGRYGEHLRC